MEHKHIVMVINDIFEDENLLVVKSKGSQATKRYDDVITKEDLKEYLSSNGINIKSCVINVVEEDWKGIPKISRW